MFFNYLTLVVALFISSIAIFYSVSGLAAIFAAATIPIIIMGSSLEVGKLIIAVWLHKYWNTAVWWLKIYLFTAMIILMVLTSIGVFGFLSKSHVEQISQSSEHTSKLSSINESLALNNNKIVRYRKEIQGLVDGTNIRGDNVLSREKKELNDVYSRMDKEKKDIREISLSTISQQQDRMDKATRRKENDIRSLGPAPRNYDVAKYQKMELSVASRAQRIIKNEQKELKNALAGIDAKYDSIIKDIQARINKLKNTNNSVNDVDARIALLENKSIKSQKVIDSLQDQKTIIETKTRQLEAEVGPIKFIAEFIYGSNSDQAMLERAVQWMILIIIIVFDPLAVLLLIASQYSFAEQHKKKLEIEEHNNDLAIGSDTSPEAIDTMEPDPEPEPEDDLDELYYDTTSKDDKEKEDTSNLLTDEEIDALSEAFNYEMTDEEIVEDFNLIEKPEKIANVWPDEVSEEENDIKEEIDKEINEEDYHVNLLKVGDDYINFNGKNYRSAALFKSHPELDLDFTSPVSCGLEFPDEAYIGELHMSLNDLPTKLYRFNGIDWDNIDKNLLSFDAYSEDYISKLVDMIGNSDYNPELLNDLEKRHIEDLFQDE